MQTENAVSPRRQVTWALRNLDLLVVIVGAPIAPLIGVPIVGYAIGAASWILLRGFGLAVDQRAMAMSNAVEQAALRLSYRLVRTALLAGAAIAALKTGGSNDGLAALAVIVIAFTIRLPLSLVEAHAAIRASASS